MKEAKRLLKLLVFVFIITSSAVLQAQTIGQVTQGLSALEAGTWPNKTCTVCWENATAANATQRLWVQDAVSSTWEKESEFRFTGWGACAASSKGIRILISDEWPRVKALGAGLDGMRDGMILNFAFNAWTGCKNNNQNCPCRNSAEGGKACIKKIAVHEFGHALGFAHEQNRKDAPEECQKDAQGANGDWWVTPYDANSIMNYCNPNWNNNGLLSDLDKTGIRLLYGGGGYLTDPILYGVNSANDLLWYKHTGHWNGTFDWAANAGGTVGKGWAFKQLFSDGDGHLYGIRDNGDLAWYNHNGFHDGSFNWSQASGAVVAKGWSTGYTAALAAGGGVIYLIKDNGDLIWYKHLGYQDGTFSWDPASGTKVGNGWTDFYAAFSGGNGVLYLINNDGDLFWYKHAGFATGAPGWFGGSSNKVGSGWKGVKQVFSAGWGQIYMIGNDGVLHYYHHLGFINGSATWGKGTGNKVGIGWAGLAMAGMGSSNPKLIKNLPLKETAPDPVIIHRRAQ